MQTNRRVGATASQRPANIVVNTHTERTVPFQAAEHGVPVCPSPPLTSPVLALIDDSETVRTILEVCLRRAGYEDVRSFPDPLTFLRWLMTPDACIPSLVIVDVNLPQMDGFSLVRLLKAKPAFAQTLVVMLSGRDGMLDKLKGRLCGAQVYLTKPFRTQDIIATMQTLLGPSSIQDESEAASSLAAGSYARSVHTLRQTFSEPIGGHL